MACFTAADSYFARFFLLLIDLPLALDVRRNLSRTSGRTATSSSSSSSSLSSLGDDDVAAEESAATLLVVIDVSNADADEEIVEMDESVIHRRCWLQHGLTRYFLR